MVDLAYEQMREDTKEVVDRASAWGFSVYRKVLDATRDSGLAGETASKVYRKILEQNGVNGHES